MPIQFCIITNVCQQETGLYHEQYEHIGLYHWKEKKSKQNVTKMGTENVVYFQLQNGMEVKWMGHSPKQYDEIWSKIK